MNPKLVAVLLVALVMTRVDLTGAQQGKTTPRLGYLSVTSPTALSTRTESFTRGLGELGYVEGQNIVIEWRFAEGKVNRLREFASELVRRNVDIIVTTGPTSTRAVKEATSTIPIVMASDTDPVGNGFVTSLGRPGGNITGLSSLVPELSGKRLELLKEVVRGLSRVAVLGTSSNPGTQQALRETELAARALRVQPQFLDLRSPEDIEAAFDEARTQRAQAVLVLGGPVALSQRLKLVDLAAKNRLPAIYYEPQFARDGGLMTYGVSYDSQYRRAATYVDKILRGAEPAELPVEQPTKFEFVINLKSAKQIGLTIPPSILGRADRVIK